MFCCSCHGEESEQWFTLVVHDDPPEVGSLCSLSCLADYVAAVYRMEAAWQ